MPLSIEELKAKLAATKIKGRRGNFLTLDPDKPVIVHILPIEDALWFLQIGSHWLGKNKVNCANPDGEGSPCYICEQVKTQKEELAAAKKEHEHDTPEEAAENAAIFLAVEEAIRRIDCRRAFAFNVLVRGEETPKLFESPWMIFNTIYTMFNSAVNDYAIDITDPHESTPFTLLRTGKGKNGTRYSASPGPRGVPLFTGPEAEAKIAEVLSKVVNLNEQYKTPEKTELATAWHAFTNGEEAATGAPAPASASSSSVPPPSRSAPPKAPPSMSRIGGKPVSTVKPPPEPDPEPDPEPEPEPEPATATATGNGAIATAGNGATNGMNEEPGEEPPPAHVPTKEGASRASNKLLTRLKGKK